VGRSCKARTELPIELRIEFVNYFIMRRSRPFLKQYFALIVQDTSLHSDFVPPGNHVLKMNIVLILPKFLHLLARRWGLRFEVRPTELFEESLDFDHRWGHLCLGGRGRRRRGCQGRGRAGGRNGFSRSRYNGSSLLSVAHCCVQVSTKKKNEMVPCRNRWRMRQLTRRLT